MAVMSIFNIGTGHTAEETNQTMKVLFDDCTSNLKYINKGPVGNIGFNAAVGWGMNTMSDDTFEAIRIRKGPCGLDTINLAGHSRGAILCHMLAHQIYAHPLTRDLNINMMLIDPVHQSKITHEGAESLDNNPRLLSYRAIIMENVNSGLYPFKFVDADVNAGKVLEDRVYYIRMPGTHGSGTQALTNPIGIVVKELVANFMRKRGTPFQTRKKSSLEMCELFAAIHAQNPVNSAGKRKIFDDVRDGAKRKTSYQSTEGRAGAVQQAMIINRTQRPLRQRVGWLSQRSKYFFNELHANFFRKAFPYLFEAWQAGAYWAGSRDLYRPELQTITTQPSLLKTIHLFLDEIDSSNF
jgi:hypothetical protein